MILVCIILIEIVMFNQKYRFVLLHSSRIMWYKFCIHVTQDPVFIWGHSCKNAMNNMWWHVDYLYYLYEWNDIESQWYSF